MLLASPRESLPSPPASPAYPRYTHLTSPYLIAPGTHVALHRRVCSAPTYTCLYARRHIASLPACGNAAHIVRATDVTIMFARLPDFILSLLRTLCIVDIGCCACKAPTCQMHMHSSHTLGCIHAFYGHLQQANVGLTMQKQLECCRWSDLHAVYAAAWS